MSSARRLDDVRTRTQRLLIQLENTSTPTGGTSQQLHPSPAAGCFGCKPHTPQDKCGARALAMGESICPQPAHFTPRESRQKGRQPAPQIQPVFGDPTGAQALRSVVVAVAVVVTVTRRVPPRRALHRSAFGSGHVEGGHLREAGAEAVSSVGWQCLQSGRAGELAVACLYLSRPRILLDLELQGLSLGKAAEAICVDVALVHEHLKENNNTTGGHEPARALRLPARCGGSAI